jgi:hypothetical protein
VLHESFNDRRDHMSILVIITREPLSPPTTANTLMAKPIRLRSRPDPGVDYIICISNTMVYGSEAANRKVAVALPCRS